MALYKDSVGGTYTKLPTKKPNPSAKGASPGPKHGRKVRYDGPKKKHGPLTGRNGVAARKRFAGEPKPRMALLDRFFNRRSKRR